MTKDKFKSKVQVSDGGCYIWRGAKDKDGYGVTSFEGKWWRAHRLSYHLFKGKIIKGNIICHTCDNPSCVSPTHLYQGTHQDNNRDTVKRGRYKNKFSVRTHCHLGHPLSGDNLYQASDKRVCKTCRREADKRRYHRSKASGPS